MIRQIITVMFLLSLLSVFGKDRNAEAPINTAGPTIEAKPALYVAVTAYSPIVEECDDTPFITAFSKRVKIGTIAISRDLEKVQGWQKGDMVYLEGIGVFEVWDRMNKRWSKAVDVFYFETAKAKEFGRVQARAVKL